MEIRPPVPEKKIFEGFFSIYGRGGHIGHVTWTIDMNFGSPFPRRLHINLALIGQAVSEKKTFDATYQVSWKSDCRFWRRFLKGFYHIWAWQPSWLCDQHHVIRFSFPCT